MVGRLALGILWFFFFFFNDTATTEIYTLSLHDALPILFLPPGVGQALVGRGIAELGAQRSEVARDAVGRDGDRKSTRLNSSHSQISYAVFCLKKKKRPYRVSTLGWWLLQATSSSVLLRS